jgi:hypothetical protein
MLLLFYRKKSIKKIIHIYLRFLGGNQKKGKYKPVSRVLSFLAEALIIYLGAWLPIPSINLPTPPFPKEI